MIKRRLLLASVFWASIGYTATASDLGIKYAGLTDDLGKASISVLRKLGYDCTTASVGIICKKCQVEDNKQICDAYICDAVTKKCRKKSAEIPALPNFGR